MIDKTYRKKNRKKIEDKIKEKKDTILEWTIISRDDDEVFIHGYFNYNLITFNDDIDLIDDEGIRFYSHDGFECNTFPHNPFMKDLKDDEELKRYNLYEKLKINILCSSNIFWSLVNFKGDSSIEGNGVYTMCIEA